jgi:hypothetical protein
MHGDRNFYRERLFREGQERTAFRIGAPETDELYKLNNRSSTYRVKESVRITKAFDKKHNSVWIREYGESKMFNHIKAEDPEVYQAIMQEVHRQRTKIELIASENFVTEAVLEAAEARSPTNTRKVIREKDITADVSMLTSSSPSPLREPRSFSEPTM